MNRRYKIMGALFVFALLATAVMPVFAERGNFTGMTGTSTHPFIEGFKGDRTGTSTPWMLERQAKYAAGQCFRDATKTAMQTYKDAMQKAQSDYKAAMMAARQAMLDAKKKAQADMMAARLAAKAQCGIQTGTSTAPTL